jgi:NAD-dependent deacetylase
VESGLSTFRDPDGLWERYRPEDLANEAAFRRDPTVVQSWYAMRREQAAAAGPNDAHRALVELEASMEDFLLITQNVDGLHARAGSRRIVELHGSIDHEYCIECGLPGGSKPRLVDGLRSCHSCAGLLRPGVVWFGEMLPAGAFERALDAARRADVFLSIGTSSVVYPAAQLPIAASDAGAFVVEINTARSAIADRMDVVLLGPAARIMPELMNVSARLRRLETATISDERDRISQ